MVGIKCRIITAATFIISSQISLLIWLNWKKTMQDESVVNVLMLSYHRSGSSFVGELLGSCEECSFFFEPLFYEDHIRNQPLARAYQENLRKLFRCEKEILDELRFNKIVWIVRKFAAKIDVYNSSTDDVVLYCQRDKVHVAKTIRMRLRDAAPLLDEISNLKIVHLVRDPRAIHNSVHHYSHVWSEEEKSANQLCKDMLDDVLVGQYLPKDRYLLLRYEDLVVNASNVTNSLLKFLHRPLTPRVEFYLNGHIKAEHHPIGQKEAHEYFSTFRNSTFVPDHWKNQLSAQKIKMIEKSCLKIMQKLDYKIFQ